MAKIAKLKTDENVAQQNSSKIEAIKELIFGENIQAYNSEFENVKKDILSKKKELEDLIDDVKSDLLKTLDTTSTDINIRITELEDKLNDRAEELDEKKLDRKQLGELLVKLGEKISQ